MQYFEKQKKLTQRADHFNSVAEAKQYPCFKLVLNDDWDDFGDYTWYSLWYLENSDRSNWVFIGDLKLMHRTGSSYEYIPNSFNELSDDFCSLGLEIAYYKKLVEKFDKETRFEITKSLCDCAINKQRQEKFQKYSAYKDSLLRDLASEKALSEGFLILTESSPDEIYGFIYKFSPIYNTEACTDWVLPIEYEPVKYKRTFALIGENGVGKTQLLSNLMSDILEKNTERMNNIPYFLSMLVICSSEYDNYRTLCPDEPKTPFALQVTEQSKEFYGSIKKELEKIIKRGTFFDGQDIKTMHDIYLELIKQEVAEKGLENLLVKQSQDGMETVRVDEECLKKMVKVLSSGQLQIFALITYVCANIHKASLLIIDEPENHLHPRLVMNFVKVLNSLLEKFESYAIISTHSPLVIREVVGENVYQLKRTNENRPLIGKVPYETFGEDISLLYHRIFDYDERNSYFTSLVEEQLTEFPSITSEQIIDSFNSDKVGLTLNGIFLIENTMSRKG